MTDPLWINADAGSPEYSAIDLRRNLGVLLLPGVTDRLGARAGVRPGGLDAVTLSGQTITVRDSNMVVYPGESATDAAYLVHFLEHTHTLDPADGSNTRIDIVVARVYDDDHDASGRREAVTEYIAGTPGGGPPATPPGALLLAEITVPAGGSSAPTLSYVAPYTVASGGILPVRNDAERPLVGQYHGMVVYHQGDDQLQVWNGSTWSPAVRGWVPIAEGTHVGGQFSIPVPAGRFTRLRLSGRGFLDSTGTVRLRINGDSTAGLHRTGIVSFDAATGAVSNPGSHQDGQQFFIADWQAVSGCTFVCELFNTDVASTVAYQSTGSRISGTASNHRISHGWGRLNSDRLVTSLNVRPFSDGDNEFQNLTWWLEGYRT